MPRDAPALFEAQRAEGQVELIVNAERFIDADFEKLCRCPRRLATYVHVRLWLEQHDIVIAHRGARPLSLELLFKRRREPPIGQRIDDAKPDIVPVTRVLGTRVTQSDDQKHKLTVGLFALGGRCRFGCSRFAFGGFCRLLFDDTS